MGGLDVFSSTQSEGSWSRPQNMGYPLNTSYDDFGIALNDSGTAGLVSSNRDTKNTTQDNIYAFTVNDLRFTLEGIAVEHRASARHGAGDQQEDRQERTLHHGPGWKIFLQAEPGDGLCSDGEQGQLLYQYGTGEYGGKEAEREYVCQAQAGDGTDHREQTDSIGEHLLRFG